MVAMGISKCIIAISNGIPTVYRTIHKRYMSYARESRKTISISIAKPEDGFDTDKLQP